MGAKQRLPVALALGILLTVVRLRDWHTGTRRDLSHGFRERDLVVQLDELEDIALGAAAKAMEKALVAVDVEGRRLFPVKRAESLPRRAAAPERDALLDHLHDIGVRLEVLDEVRREERHLFLELDHGDTAAALFGWG